MSSTTINGSQIRAGAITDANINASAAIATTKLADGSLFIKSDGSVAFGANQSMGSHRLTNLADPTTGSDAATQSWTTTQINNAINGLAWKTAARVASTANVSVSSAPSTIDGVTLATNDRILLKNQTTGSENGIYAFNGAASALTRTTDATAGELNANTAIFVSEGTANADTQWQLTTNNPITVGTTSLTWAQIGGATSYTGSNGISVAGTVISPTYGSASNTICQGNDSRLSDARTPVGTALAATNIWVGTSGNVAAAVALSGDVTLSNTGVATVANQVKLSKYIVRETPSGTINGSNVTFTLANTPVSGTEEVYLNGIQQEPGAGNDYTISGGTITYLTAPITGDRLRVTYIST